MRASGRRGGQHLRQAGKGDHAAGGGEVHLPFAAGLGTAQDLPIADVVHTQAPVDIQRKAPDSGEDGIAEVVLGTGGGGRAELCRPPGLDGRHRRKTQRTSILDLGCIWPEARCG